MTEHLRLASASTALSIVVMARLTGRFGIYCGVWLALLAATTVSADPSGSPQSTAGTGAADSVKEITLDPNAKEPVCRRYVPTGSRIAKQRCETPSAATTTADSAERDQLRRDIEEMRSRQLMLDQARALARAEALRRRTGQ